MTKENTRDQIEARAAVTAGTVLGLPSVVGTYDMQSLVTTNIERMKVYELDFAGAVVASADGHQKPGATFKHTPQMACINWLHRSAFCWARIRTEIIGFQGPWRREIGII